MRCNVCLWKLPTRDQIWLCGKFDAGLQLVSRIKKQNKKQLICSISFSSHLWIMFYLSQSFISSLFHSLMFPNLSHISCFFLLHFLSVPLIPLFCFSIASLFTFHSQHIFSFCSPYFFFFEIFLSLYFIASLIPSHIPHLSLTPPLILYPFPLLSYSPVSLSLCFICPGFPHSLIFPWLFLRVFLFLSCFYIMHYFKASYILYSPCLSNFLALSLSCYFTLVLLMQVFGSPLLKKKAVSVKSFCITLIKADIVIQK